MNKYKVKHIVSFEAKFLLVAFVLSLIYELGHSPLYNFVDAPTLGRKLYYIFHCSLRDLAPFLFGYHLVALLLKNWLWIYGGTNWKKIGLFTFFAFIYTVASEMYHVHILKSWSFKESMPIVPILEIGLTPFLQNLILAPLSAVILNYFESRKQKLIL
ncbi:MAG: hypothetical protein GXO74_05055 [Calditrichaeota bacterium]|nr:hypothetical protein [Calditrichota bacterium]